MNKFCGYCGLDSTHHLWKHPPEKPRVRDFPEESTRNYDRALREWGRLESFDDQVYCCRQHQYEAERTPPIPPFYRCDACNLGFFVKPESPDFGEWRWCSATCAEVAVTRMLTPQKSAAEKSASGKARTPEQNAAEEAATADIRDRMLKDYSPSHERWEQVIGFRQFEQLLLFRRYWLKWETVQLMRTLLPKPALPEPRPWEAVPKSRPDGLAGGSVSDASTGEADATEETTWTSAAFKSHHAAPFCQRATAQSGAGERCSQTSHRRRRSLGRSSHASPRSPKDSRRGSEGEGDHVRGGGETGPQETWSAKEDHPGTPRTHPSGAKKVPRDESRGPGEESEYLPLYVQESPLPTQPLVVVPHPPQKLVAQNSPTWGVLDSPEDHELRGKPLYHDIGRVSRESAQKEVAHGTASTA